MDEKEHTYEPIHMGSETIEYCRHCKQAWWDCKGKKITDKEEGHEEK